MKFPSFKKFFSFSSLALVLCFFLLLSTVKLSNVRTKETFNEEDPSINVPIVMYHHICESQKMLGKYVISPQEFENDLIFLKENGYTPIFVADLIAYAREDITLPEKPIILSFDDGYESTIYYAHPLLQKYAMKGVCSVIGTYSELYSNTKDKHINYSHLTWDQIKEMQDSGLWEIGNHSYDMHDLKKTRRGIKKLASESNSQYKEILTKDLSKLQEKLLEVTGQSPTLFTYPFGYISKQSDDILRNMGFTATLSCEEGMNKITKNQTEFYRLKRYNRPHNINTAEFIKQVCGE